MKVLDPTEQLSNSPEGQMESSSVAQQNSEEAACPYLLSEFWRMQQIDLSHVSTPQIHVLSQIIQLNALRIAAMYKYSYIYKNMV